MIIDCVSDLHGSYPDLEGGDLLIVAGDHTTNDTLKAWMDFFNWIAPLKYKKKVYIAGNHDKFLKQWITSSATDELGIERDDPSLEYLCDSGMEFEGLRIWGSPWTPWFAGVNPLCDAFMLSEEKLAAKYALIPKDTDILITHGPPWGVLDQSRSRVRVGSQSLLNAITRIRPKLHIFGHIHEGYGQSFTEYSPDWPDSRGTQFVNCAHMDRDYQPVNKPIRIII